MVLAVQKAILSGASGERAGVRCPLGLSDRIPEYGFWVQILQGWSAPFAGVVCRMCRGHLHAQFAHSQQSAINIQQQVGAQQVGFERVAPYKVSRH